MTKITKGSGNVFADLGFKDAAEMLTRAELTHQIQKIIRGRGLTQKQAAKLLGLKQPDVSQLVNGKFVDFSLDRLLSLLTRLNQDIEIVIRPRPKGKYTGGDIHVSAS